MVRRPSPPAPPRQTAGAPPASAAPLESAPLEGTEGRQQAINTQVQQGLAALGFKVARTDGRIDGSTREAIRRFASQQKVKAPETPDDDFLLSAGLRRLSRFRNFLIWSAYDFPL